MSNPQFNAKVEKLQTFLGETSQHLSEVTGFVKRRSKVSGSVFVMMVVLGWVEKGTASLNELIHIGQRLGVRVSAAGLHQRFNGESVALMQRLFAQSLQSLGNRENLAVPLLQAFSGVYILDSTIIVLPAVYAAMLAGQCYRHEAALKVQFSYEYLRGNMNAIALTAGNVPDQNSSLHLDDARPNSLHLFDLGYFKQQVFVKLASAGAFFISRLQTQVAFYAQPDAAKPLALVGLLREQTADCGELTLYMGRQARLAVRVIFDKLPPAIAAKRRRKARLSAQNRHQTCSAQHLALQDYALFITNVPASQLTPPQVALVYRLRWQIELLFKLWKSQLHLNAVGHCQPHRLLTQLYARLIGLVLFHWLIAPLRLTPTAELSLPKAFALFQQAIPSLVRCLQRQGYGLLTWWATLYHDLAHFAPKTPRRTTPSTLQRLLLAGLA